MGIAAKLAALNDADLSKLAQRIAELRAQALADLTARGEDPNRPITAADLAAAGQQTGLSAEQLLAALEKFRTVS
jgi:recombinational DNA repair ATPase RecF